MRNYFFSEPRIIIAGFLWLFCSSLQAQTSNGPLFGIYLNRLDEVLNKDYRAFDGSVQGLGGSIGYFVEGSGEKSISLRGEFQGSVRRYLYDFKNVDAYGSHRITIMSLQVPLLFKIRLNEGLRFIVGPAVDLRFSGNAHVDGTRVPGGEDINWSDDFTKNLKPFGVSLIGGLEYRTNGSIAIGLRAQKGVSKVVKNIKGVDATTVDLGIVVSVDILGGRNLGGINPEQE